MPLFFYRNYYKLFRYILYEYDESQMKRIIKKGEFVMLTYEELMHQKNGKVALENFSMKLLNIVNTQLRVWPFDKRVKVQLPSTLIAKYTIDAIKSEFTNLDFTIVDDNHIVISYTDIAQAGYKIRVDNEIKNILERMEGAQQHFLEEAGDRKFEFVFNYDHAYIAAVEQAIEEFGFVVRSTDFVDKWRIVGKGDE